MLAMVVLSAATTFEGSGAKSSFGPYICPVVIAPLKNGFRVVALGLLLGTIAYVNVEIGYAPGAEAGGSVIEILLSDGIDPTVAAAAEMLETPGTGYFPAAFWISASSNLL